MYDDFIKYINDNNINQIDWDVMNDYLDGRTNYSDEEKNSFLKECVEKRKELKLDSENLTDTLCLIEDDEYLKKCIDERREELEISDVSLLLMGITDKEYVLKCLEKRREELGLTDSFNIEFLVAELEDEELKKEWTKKGKKIGLKSENIESLISNINDEKFTKECLLKAKAEWKQENEKREFGLNWQKQYELLKKIEDEEFKFDFMKEDYRYYTKTAKIDLIKDENNVEFIKKCVKEHRELGINDVVDILEKIKDEQFIVNYIKEGDVSFDGKVKLFLGKLNDEKYDKDKYDFLMNNDDIDKESLVYQIYINDIINSINDKEILKKILEDSKGSKLHFVEEYHKPELIKKINNPDYTKEGIENWKEIGLSDWDVRQLIYDVNDKELAKKIISSNEKKDNNSNQEKDISEYVIADLIEYVNDNEYTKECIEKHKEIGLSGERITSLLKKMSDEEYTKSILLNYEKYGISRYDVPNMIKELTDKTFIETFTSKFNKKENIGFGWQKDCQEIIGDKNKVILSSPTGSGKTRVFLEWAMRKEERPIYITAPIKALSNQRYRELKEKGINVGIETGDIKNVPKNCDIICCTQEIYTNKYTKNKNATCIMDEFHYIFESEDRARSYIDGLHKSQAKNLLICSATFGDIEKFRDYVKKVSNEDFYVYKSDSRLTNLNYKANIEMKNIHNSLVIAFSNSGCKKICSSLKNNRKDIQKYSIDESKENKLNELSKKYNIKNKDLLEYAKYGLAYYYGALVPKEKAFIEEMFENRVIDTVAGTDALAMGVNFPVQNVVFAQTVKYGTYGNCNRISKNLFEQLSGRAGRKGFYDEGNVYYCDDFEYEIEARGYYTEEEYLQLLMSDNEDVSIKIKPDIKSILKGEKSIQEEVEFVKSFSTQETNVEDEILNVLEEKDQFIENFRNEIANPEYEINKEEKKVLQFNADTLSKEFEKNIGDVYFEGFDPETNFYVFSSLIKNREGYDYQDCYEDYNYRNNCNENVIKYGKLLNCLINDNENIDNTDYRFGELMQMRAYINQLPKQYRHNVNICKLEKLIDGIDETVLHQEKGKLSIDEVRNGISKNLNLNDLENAINDVNVAKCDEASRICTKLLENQKEY